LVADDTGAIDQTAIGSSPTTVDVSAIVESGAELSTTLDDLNAVGENTSLKVIISGGGKLLHQMGRSGEFYDCI
jgi:hypothetical protein